MLTLLIASDEVSVDEVYRPVDFLDLQLFKKYTWGDERSTVQYENIHATHNEFRGRENKGDYVIRFPEKVLRAWRYQALQNALLSKEQTTVLDHILKMYEIQHDEKSPELPAAFVYPMDKVRVIMRKELHTLRDRHAN